MGGSAARYLDMFKKLCGVEAMSNVVIATTMWDLVPPVEGMRREMELKCNPRFWGDMIKMGSMVRRQCGVESAMDIVESFLLQGVDVTLDIQKELRNGVCMVDTAAGRLVCAGRPN